MRARDRPRRRRSTSPSGGPPYPPWRAIYSSPLTRTRETAAILGKALDIAPWSDLDLVDCNAGEWAGAALKDLVKKPEWATVVHYPSGFRFPGGESMQRYERPDRRRGQRSWWAGTRDRACDRVPRRPDQRPSWPTLWACTLTCSSGSSSPPLPSAPSLTASWLRASCSSTGRARRATCPSQTGPATGGESEPKLSASFDLESPTRVTVGAVGPPGKRVFYLQARQEDQLVSLKLEKEQVLFLAGGLSEVMADLAAPAAVPAESELELEQPVLAEWAVGSMQLAYDPAADRVVLVARESPRTRTKLEPVKKAPVKKYRGEAPAETVKTRRPGTGRSVGQRLLGPEDEETGSSRHRGGPRGFDPRAGGRRHRARQEAPAGRAPSVPALRFPAERGPLVPQDERAPGAVTVSRRHAKQAKDPERRKRECAVDGLRARGR